MCVCVCVCVRVRVCVCIYVYKNFAPFGVKYGCTYNIPIKLIYFEWSKKYITTIQMFFIPVARWSEFNGGKVARLHETNFHREIVHKGLYGFQLESWV